MVKTSLTECAMANEIVNIDFYYAMVTMATRSILFVISVVVG